MLSVDRVTPVTRLRDRVTYSVSRSCLISSRTPARAEGFSADSMEKDISSLKTDVGTLKKDVKSIKKNMRYVKKTINVLVPFFNKEDVQLQKRVRRIEDHLGITA